jgi:dihydroflavonol-4-reductase
MKKRIFVTGANGFIGKHLVAALAKKAFDVTALVRKKEDVAKLKKLGAKKVVVGDISNPKAFSKELNACHTLVHLAALRSNWMPEKEFNRVNSDVLNGLLKEAKKIRHVIITSSVYVHGVHKDLPINENSSLNAKDMYGKSKIRAEEITRDATSKTKVPYTIIRPAIVYGPEDNESGMVMKMITLVKNKKLPIIGDGKNTLHLIYIDDLIDGYIKAIQKGGRDETYILAGEKSIQLSSLANLVKKELQIEYTFPHLPKTPIYVLSFVVEKIFLVGLKMAPSLFKKEPPLLPTKVETLSFNWQYDISKSNKDLHFRPKVNYNHGIKKTVSWYIKHSIA